MECIRRHLATAVVAFVVASLAGGGTAIVANADTVDGYHANQLIRLSRSQTDDDAIVRHGLDHVARVTTIGAPRRGFLSITASTDVNGGTASGRCWIELGGTFFAASDRIYVPDDNEEDCAARVAMPVGRGRHEIRFFGNPDSGTTFDGAAQAILFAGFNGNGSAS
jgi:hypothetical protein